MEMELYVIVLCVIIFAVAGFMDAIAGGGGLITLPSLMLLNIPPHVVLGTNKFACSLGCFTAIWPFLRKKLIVLHLIPVGFVASFSGGALGSWLALQVEPDLLGRIMAFLLPLGLACSVFSGKKRSAMQAQELPLSTQRIYVALVGVIIGVYDGFFGPATGSFFILGLHMLLGMDLIPASGTTKVLNLASNLGALATFASGGVVLYALAIPCAVGSIIGNQLGAHFAIKVGVKVIRMCLYIAMFLLFGTLLYKYFVLGM